MQSKRDFTIGVFVNSCVYRNNAEPIISTLEKKMVRQTRLHLRCRWWTLGMSGCGNDYFDVVSFYFKHASFGSIDRFLINMSTSSGLLDKRGTSAIKLSILSFFMLRGWDPFTSMECMHMCLEEIQNWSQTKKGKEMLAAFGTPGRKFSSLSVPIIEVLQQNQWWEVLDASNFSFSLF